MDSREKHHQIKSFVNFASASPRSRAMTTFHSLAPWTPQCGHLQMRVLSEGELKTPGILGISLLGRPIGGWLGSARGNRQCFKRPQSRIRALSPHSKATPSSLGCSHLAGSHLAGSSFLCALTLHSVGRVRVSGRACTDGLLELSTRDLRKILDRAGARTAGRYEREALLELLRDPQLRAKCEALVRDAGGDEVGCGSDMMG